MLLSGDLNGHLTPCGCSKPMLGGLPRRASYLKSLGPVAALVRVENGDLTGALGRQDEVKAETVIEMLNGLNYDAVNLGEKDFRLGVPYLTSLQARFKGRLLCANAQRADGTALFAEHATITRTAGAREIRVVIAGVLSDQYADSIRTFDPDVRVESPTACLERLQPALAAAGEVRILLYHGPKAEAADLARQFKLFQLVVCAHEADHSEELRQAGASVVACSGQDGKYLGQAILTNEDGRTTSGPHPRRYRDSPSPHVERGTGGEVATPAGWRVAEVRYRQLGPELRDDPAAMQIDRAYLDRVAAEQLLEKVPKSPTRSGDRYAGTAACATCHAAEHATWRASGHARAMQTLVTAGHDRDPECAGCHAVGLDRVSGFITREKTPELEDVGCESCHGPAAKHARDPKVALPKAGEEACNSCHVLEHSPKFGFASYWQKIRH